MLTPEQRAIFQAMIDAYDPDAYPMSRPVYESYVAALADSDALALALNVCRAAGPYIACVTDPTRPEIDIEADSYFTEMCAAMAELEDKLNGR